MNTLKKLSFLLLAICLWACGREENLVAQTKPRKTIKEALCREWHLDNLHLIKTYTKKDTFGIIFYPNHTFILRIDPKIQKVTYIKGTWKFRKIWEEDYICDATDGICTYSTELQLLSDGYVENMGYCYEMFKIGQYSKIQYLSNDELSLKPPLVTYEDQRSFSFSIKK
jgi:hypothetical protein